MSVSRKDIIAKGRYNVWNMKDLALIILFAVLVTASVFLFKMEDFREYSYYVMGAAALVLLIEAVVISLKGSFHISRFSIVWKPIGGAMKSIAYDKLGGVALEYDAEGRASWVIQNQQAQVVKKFKNLSSAQSAGASILFFRYKDVLPEVVFNYWQAEKRGKRTYDELLYKLKIDGTVVAEMLGAAVFYDHRVLFLPTSVSETLSSPEIKVVEQADLLLPEGKYQPDRNIATHTLVEAVIESDLPAHIRDAYLEQIAQENGGRIFANMSKTGRQWQIFNEGVEVEITRI